MTGPALPFHKERPRFPHRDPLTSPTSTGGYTSAAEAFSQIFEFDTQKWGPNVVRLQVHLPTTLDQDGHSETALTAYFKANADTGEIGEEARKRTFLEFPEFFVYNKSQWTLRRQTHSAVGYMPSIQPAAGELHYLRTLLTFVKGATSFEDLRKVPGHAQPLPTFRAACLAQGHLTSC